MQPHHRDANEPPSAPCLFLAHAAIALLLVTAALTAPACGQLDTAQGPPDTAPQDDASYGGALVEDDAPADQATTLVLPVSMDAGTSRPTPIPTPSQDSGFPGQDAAPDGACAQPVAAGDLAMEELMIASVSGAGDYGQWIEVRSSLGCTANLLGLHGECAKGAKVNTFDVTSDLWVDPMGSFIVADSSDPVVNHYLPGTVIVWAGEPGDVLRKEGATVTLTLGSAIIDSITYPDFKGPVGTTLSFPSDCLPSQRSDWTEWQLSTASWFPGFFGTPNAANNDVTCP